MPVRLNRRRGAIDARMMMIAALSVVVIAGIAVFITVSKRPAAVVGKANAPDWVRQKAQECRGDMVRLDRDDQQRLIAMYGLPEAPSRIARVYRSMHVAN